MATSVVKGWLFIKRGVLSMLSYRMALILGVFSAFVSLVQFGVMARFLSEGNSFPLLAQYGGNLLAYLIIGSAFTAFVGVSLTGFQGAIRSEQQMGTLEHLLLSNTPLGAVLLYSALWSFLYTLLNTGILLAFVIVLFNVPLDANLMSAGVVLLLTILSLSGLGLMSAGVVMVTKQGDPIAWIFTTLSGLLSGVLFPVEVLPRYLQTAAYVLPTTHALKALRLALLCGTDLGGIIREVVFLAAVSCLTIPLGLVVLRLGFDKARASGTLGEY